MSSLYINTIQIMGGILTPIIIVLLLLVLVRALEAVKVKIEERREERKYRPQFSVRLHEVPNPNMWGVEISKNGVVLQDVGVDKL